MILVILIYHPDGSKGLLQVHQDDAVANAQIHLNNGSSLRVLNGCDLSNIGTTLDPRIPDTLQGFDLLYPHQPAIIK